MTDISATTQGDMTAHEGALPAAQQSAERPSWLPEGFANGEELAARYAELERSQGNVDSTDHASSAASSESVPASQSDAEVLVASAGLDFESLNQEYASQGSLSAKSYADLERAGISRETVDAYIEGQAAVASGIKAAVFSAAGGADAYADMVGWAAVNLTAHEIDAYNAQMNSGDEFQMRLAVDGLKAQFVAENGSAPKLIGGTSGQSSRSSGDVFASTSDLTAAMKDPRYSTDASYRDAVIAKIGRSSIL